MRLYLVRHAETFEPSAKRWPDDRLRPLTPEGMRAFRKAASGIAHIAGTVDCVLASPLLRARQTAEILAEVADWPRAVQATELAPDEAAERALAAARERDVARLAIVGHEPNLKDLISLSLAGHAAELDCRFEKGAAACLKFSSAVRAGAARLEWLIRPETLCDLGKR
jgi:phosphohistidine phosphatase